MAFMVCRTHLNRELNTTGDILDPVQQGIGSYLQTPRNKPKGSGKAPKTSTKTIFTTELASKQRTLSQQQQGGDEDLGDKDTREDRNNQEGQCTGGNNPDDSGSGSSSDSGSSRASSVTSILWLLNNNR